MNAAFIVNPAAGKGKAKSFIPIIKHICDKNDVKYDIHLTTEPLEATNASKELAASGVERIIACGGDGTVNEVVNGIAGTQAALGVLPGGTGNDFIKSINDNKSIEDFVYDNLFGEIKPIDLGKCGKKYFINIGSLGLDSEVVIASNSIKKLFTGSTAYWLSIAKTLLFYKGYNVKVCIDNTIEFESDMLMAAIANGRYYGSSFKPAPDADLFDGLFDICFCRNTTLPRILKLLPTYKEGTHLGAREFSFYRGKKVLITSDDNIAVNIDGEVFIDKKVEFEIVEKGINVIFPL